MFDLAMGDPETVLLNLSNILLGVVTLAGVLVAAAGAIHELAARMIKRTRPRHAYWGD
jgi:hypothetical protein